jgi:hypothetical protein
MVARATSLVLTDISGETNRVELQFTNTLENIRTFGSNWPNRVGGLRDVTIPFLIYYSTTTDEALELLRTWFLTYPDESRIVQIDIPDDTPGSDRYTIPCKLQELSINAQSGTSAPIEVTGTWAIHGEPTISTIAT